MMWLPSRNAPSVKLHLSHPGLGISVYRAQTFALVEAAIGWCSAAWINTGLNPSCSRIHEYHPSDPFGLVTPRNDGNYLQLQYICDYDVDNVNKL